MEDFWRTLLAYHDIHEPSWFYASKQKILNYAEVFTKLFVDNPDCHKMGRNELYHYLSSTPVLSDDWRLPMRSFLDALHWASKHRRFAITKSGDSALVMAFAHEGYSICMIPGGKIPFVIFRGRAGETTQYYRFCGDAYVHGLIGWRPPKSARKDIIRLG